MLVARAPIDGMQGVIQKILYVHPPLAYGAYLGFVLTAVGGALYLWSSASVCDHLARRGRRGGRDLLHADDGDGPDLGEGHLGTLVVAGIRGSR